MNPLIKLMQERVLILDGAMGTMLLKHGLAADGSLPEFLNLTNPEAITKIHREYVKAGADVITANTFGAHELKLGSDANAAVSAAIACAKAAGAPFVALDIGPLGALMAPLGPVSFEEAYSIYKKQIIAGASAGADLVIIETISDPYEAKAAILAAKENSNLPVFCTMTFGEDGRTFFGCDALAAVTLLEGLGVCSLGVNCSLGPQSLLPVVEKMLSHSRVPILVQANAGLPVIKDGAPSYDISPDEYAAAVSKMVQCGVRAVGGCCGTSPEYISAVKSRVENIAPVKKAPKTITVCSASSKALIWDGFIEVGERLNPTGRAKMIKALEQRDEDYLIDEAMSQVDEGAQILDLNVGAAGIDEPETLAWATRTIQSAVPGVPLMLDSASPAAIEAALRVYNGKAIINSVNGKKESMEQIFPLAKKFGALVVCMTMDELEIPETAEGRLEIAKKIQAAAHSFGISDADLLIDPITMTAAASEQSAKETLRAVSLVRNELGLKTILGTSNISFGLPKRDALNAAFLAETLGAGLSSAILNPAQIRCREALALHRTICGDDQGCEEYIKAHSASRSPSIK